VELKVVEGDRGVGEKRGESESLGRGKVGFLKTKDIRGGQKVAEGGTDDIATVGKVGGSTVVRKAVNIIGDNTRDREGKVRKKEERGGRTRGAERAVKH
jgi:hypothetical protein